MAGTEHPTCDHRECRHDPNPAVAKFEFTHPPARTFRAWACAEHDPGGPALKRVDPSPGNRPVDTGTKHPGGDK